MGCVTGSAAPMSVAVTWRGWQRMWTSAAAVVVVLLSGIYVWCFVRCVLYVFGYLSLDNPSIYLSMVVVVVVVVLVVLLDADVYWLLLSLSAFILQT